MTSSTTLVENGAHPARREKQSPAWLPAVILFIVYGLFIAQYLGQGRDARDFIWLSARWVRHSHASHIIRYDPHYHYATGHNDYDGEYYYFIALDPLHATGYLDEPANRYTRIVYPLLVRLLAIGQPNFIPYTMILVNWLCIPLGAWFVALWLRKRRLSVWLALIYGLYAGLFISFERDLTDPLAYTFVALAVLLYDDGRRNRLLLSALTFALAGLTRETAVVFALGYGVSLAFQNGTGWRQIRARVPQTALYLSLSVGPLVLLSALLNISMGVRRNGALPEWIPFEGILSFWPWSPGQAIQVGTVIVPAMICTALTLWALRRGWWTPAFAALLATVVLFVIFGSRATYFHYTASGRYSVAIMLAALYCIPIFDRLTHGRRWWLLLSAVGWLAVTPIEYSAYILRPFV
jgi:hypothetical protein